MTALPDKPDAVAHVSDALWETALDATSRMRGISCFKTLSSFNEWTVASFTDHARCLILLGELVEPVDPIEAAIEAAWCEYRDRVYAALDCAPFFEDSCRKHFSGLTFPVHS